MVITIQFHSIIIFSHLRLIILQNYLQSNGMAQLLT